MPTRSFTPVAPPFILAVYLVFAFNRWEGVSVTEVGSVEGFQLRVALIGLVLLPENSWTVLEVSVDACSASENLAVTLESRSTPLVPSAGVTASTSGAVVSGGIFALGQARVEKGGLPLDSPDWIQKSRELLFYLLSHPEGRTKEQIGLALWPEASTAQLRSSFHDTVFRLRRALGGKEWVLFERRRYAFNLSLGYSYDVEAFEEDLSAARRLLDEAPEQAIVYLQEAAGLYGGDFLEDLAESGWALERQDELRRAHGESLLLLGGLLVARGRHAEAADAYRQAISHDRFLEEAHRGLMRSQVAMGERGGRSGTTRVWWGCWKSSLAPRRPPRRARSTNACEPAKTFEQVTRHFGRCDF